MGEVSHDWENDADRSRQCIGHLVDIEHTSTRIQSSRSSIDAAYARSLVESLPSDTDRRLYQGMTNHACAVMLTHLASDFHSLFFK